MMFSLLKRIYLKVLQSKFFFPFPHLKFYLLYLLDDPWSLSSVPEAVRFSYGVDYLLKNFESPSLIIDFGCGVGYYSKLLSQHSTSYIGLDISHSAIERARRNNPDLDFLQIDNVFELHRSIPSHSGNVVTLFEVLYYVPDPQKFLYYLKLHYKNIVISYLLSPPTDLDYLFSPLHLELNSSIFHLHNKKHRFVCI